MKTGQERSLAPDPLAFKAKKPLQFLELALTALLLLVLKNDSTCIVDSGDAIENARIADVRDQVDHDVVQKLLAVAKLQVADSIADSLRMSAALSNDEAESNHLAIGDGKAVARVVITEAVLGNKLVEVTAVLRSDHPAFADALAVNLSLDIVTSGQTLGTGNGLLRLKRHLDALGIKYLVSGLDEVNRTAKTKIREPTVFGLICSR